MAHHRIGLGAVHAGRRLGDLEVDLGLVLLAGVVGVVDDRFEQLRQVEGLRLAARQLRIEPRGVRDVGDEAVQPLHVMVHDLDEALALLRRLGIGQRLDSTAERGQRVLELMAHIRREGLDGGDAVVERVGHVAHRAREIADLVAARREIRNLDALVDAAPHALGGSGQLAQRQRDGGGEQRGEQHGDERHEAEGHQHHLALGAQHVVDLAARGGEHERAQHGAEALHRHGHEHDDLAPVVEADEADLGAVQRGGDFGKILAVVEAVFDLPGIVVAEGPGDQPVPQGNGAEALAVRIEGRQVGLHDVAARIEEAAVDDQVAVLVDDARAHRGVGEEPLQHRARGFGIDRESRGSRAGRRRAAPLRCCRRANRGR